MHSPELDRTQSVAPSTGAGARTDLSDEVIRHIALDLFEQGIGADRWQRWRHA